jgi:hypothetical protein
MPVTPTPSATATGITVEVNIVNLNVFIFLPSLSNFVRTLGRVRYQRERVARRFKTGASKLVTLL